MGRIGKKGGSTPKEFTWIVTPLGCHECTSHKPNRINVGYPRMKRDGKAVSVHRYIYSQKFLDGNPIPDGLVIRHKCDNSICINPDHLEIGTQQDNISDTTSRGRHQACKGTKNGNAKLSEHIIPVIIQSSETNVKLASKYGVSSAVISGVRRRKNWKHVPLMQDLAYRMDGQM